MSQPLLLDEMFSDNIARQLRAKGHDVTSVVADPALMGLPDDQILAYATTEGRTLVTANIKDFVPLDGRYRAGSQSHAGLILVSAKTFPQNRGFIAAITTALMTLLSRTAKIQPGQVLSLTRGLVVSPVGSSGSDPGGGVVEVEAAAVSRESHRGMPVTVSHGYVTGVAAERLGVVAR